MLNQLIMLRLATIGFLKRKAGLLESPGIVFGCAVMPIRFYAD